MNLDSLLLNLNTHCCTVQVICDFSNSTIKIAPKPMANCVASAQANSDTIVEPSNARSIPAMVLAPTSKANICHLPIPIVSTP